MIRRSSDPYIRDGFTLAELLVAATLLLAGLAFVATGIVQTKRLMQDTRNYNIAVDELSNQLERLTAMGSAERDRALSDLQPSEAIRLILNHVSLKAEEIRDDDGDRIVMSIRWDRIGPATLPTLVGWIVPDASSKLVAVPQPTDRFSRMEMLNTRKQGVFEEMQRDTNISSLFPGFAGERAGVRGPSFQAIRPLTPPTLSPRHPSPNIKGWTREEDFRIEFVRQSSAFSSSQTGGEGKNHLETSPLVPLTLISDGGSL